MKAYIKLDEKDFVNLIRGKEVILKDKIRDTEVHIILADIGLDRIHNHAQKAWFDFEDGKPL